MDTEKLSVTLPVELAALVRHQVDSGAYDSVNAVVRDALQLWQQNREARVRSLNGIRERIEQAANNPVRISDQDLARKFDQLVVDAEARERQ